MMKRFITTKRLPSRRASAKQKQKPKARSCPVRAVIECLQFPPIPKLPNEAGVTPEQMAEAGVHPNQTLYWFSECESVWLETEYHFARILGKHEIWGSPFVPDKSKTDSRYYLRPAKLFTAHESLVVKLLGTVNPAVPQRTRAKVAEIIIR